MLHSLHIILYVDQTNGSQQSAVISCRQTFLASELNRSKFINVNHSLGNGVRSFSRQIVSDFFAIASSSTLL